MLVIMSWKNQLLQKLLAMDLRETILNIENYYTALLWTLHNLVFLQNLGQHMKKHP